MKFFTLATLIGLASPTNAGLRLLSDPSSEVVQVSLIVDGLSGPVSEDDGTIISDTMATALEAVIGARIYNIGHREMARSTHWWYFDGWGCRMCDDDRRSLQQDEDEQRVLVTGTFELPKSSIDANDFGEFEETICAILRATGSTNLAYAKDCKFSFLGTEGKDLTVMGGPHQCDQAKTIQATLYGVATDVLEEIDPNVFDIVLQSIVTSYNKVFEEVGMKMHGSSTFVDAFTQGEDGLMLMGTFKPLCSPDLAHPLNTKNNDMHSNFEDEFCKILADYDDFQALSDCRLHIVARPTKEKGI